MLRSSKILLAEASLWRYKSKFFYRFADIFQEALWRLGNRLVSMGKAGGIVGSEGWVFWMVGAALPLLPGSYGEFWRVTRECLGLPKN